jgi:uncharacterized protein YutE (UPF0331/DUF86 family)
MIRRLSIDRGTLPALFPTHTHSKLFWERLGRTIATCGFLEEVLRKAIFLFTATRRYSADEIEGAYEAWLPILERALTAPLSNLAESYGKAVRENQDSTIKNVEELVGKLKKAATIRNILCHGSWRIPDAEGRSLPSFNKRNKALDYIEVCETKFDTQSLRKVQDEVLGLACDVIDTVTQMGWQFPGGGGPGETVWL